MDRTPFDDHAQGYAQTVNRSIAFSGDSVDYFAKIKAAFAAQELSGARGTLRILDFGCGVGVSTRALAAARNWNVTGVDPSRDSIETARTIASNGIRFEHQASNVLPFENASFDAVFTACVFHHIDRVMHSHWLAEIRRVLMPGGAFLIFEHNPLNPLTRLAVRDCSFDADVTLLPAWYTVRLLRAGGFRATKPRFYYFFPNALAALRPFERFLGRFPFGGQYFVKGIASA